MAISKPNNSGYSVILGSTTGSNGSKVDTWIEYKVLSQSIANNTSQVRVILYSQADFTSQTAHEVTRQFGYVQIGSDQQYYTMSGGYDFSNKQLNKFADHTFTVAHNANGTKTVTIKGAWSDSGWSTYITGGSASASVALPTIPQYATANISLGARTETSLTINWSTDQTIDYLWYSTNGGTSYTAIGAVNGTSGQFMITGLTANTTYSVKIKVRNKSSQLQSESGASSLATYSYPYASNMPDFTIGNNVTIDFYNPLGRTFTFYVILNDTQISDSNTISTNHFIGLSDASTISHLYACIPSSKSGTYKIKCTYNDGTAHTITKTGGTASAKESDCKPTIGSVSYQDNNSTAYAITGDRSKIVQNISTVGYTASSLTAKYSADLASCKVSVNGQTIDLTLSGSSASGGSAVIDSGTNVTATFTLTDSRGFTATKTATVTMVGYAVPSAILSVERQNNYYSETDITVDADYTHIGTNAVTIQYRARQQGGSYGSWTTIQDNVTATANLDNTYAWDIQIKLTDSFGGTTTYNTKISRGMPIVYFDRLREAVGINSFPQEDQSLYLNGQKIWQGWYAQRGEGQILTNDDLNDYTEAGVYYSSSSTISQSLLNSPYTEGIWTGTTGFRMEVLTTTGDGFGVQKIITHNLYTAVFYRTLNAGAWQPWHQEMLSLYPASPTQLKAGDGEMLTLASGVTLTTNDIYRTGHIVNINGRIQTTAQISGGGTIISGFPQGAGAHSYQLQFYAVNYASSSTPCRLFFNGSSGILGTVSALASGADLRVTFTYICK